MSGAIEPRARRHRVLSRLPALRPCRWRAWFWGLWAWACLSAAAAPTCDKPVYLTFDTGHMGVADLVADVLRRHQVRVTFFAAHEPTQVGDGSLGEHWAPWWRARASEGHVFASHTHDHVYWLRDQEIGRAHV